MAVGTRRVLVALMLTALFGAAGSVALVGVASATPRLPAAGSATPGVATSTTSVLGEHFVRYCVKNFAPGSTVKVTNELTGAVVVIHSNQAGRGCAEVPIKRACHATTQTIMASGTGANGKPATSSATVTAPPTKSLCEASSGGTLPFTGSSIIIPAVLIGIVLIMVGSAAVTAARRRRGMSTV